MISSLMILPLVIFLLADLANSGSLDVRVATKICEDDEEEEDCAKQVLQS